jgi:hypothetical protein
LREKLICTNLGIKRYGSLLFIARHRVFFLCKANPYFSRCDWAMMDSDIPLNIFHFLATTKHLTILFDRKRMFFWNRETIFKHGLWIQNNSIITLVHKFSLEPLKELLRNRKNYKMASYDHILHLQLTNYIFEQNKTKTKTEDPRRRDSYLLGCERVASVRTFTWALASASYPRKKKRLTERPSHRGRQIEPPAAGCSTRRRIFHRG